MEKLIGREEEKKLLLDTLQSSDAELIVVYGRRRVGKTFLIRSVYENKLLFELSGIHNASLKQQLQNFSMALKKTVGQQLIWLLLLIGLKRFMYCKRT